MAPADAYNPASSARRFPGPWLHRSARVRHPAAPQRPERAPTPHPSPGDSRSSASPVVGSAQVCWPPVSRRSLPPSVDSAPPLRQPRPAAPTIAKLHRRARPVFVLLVRCLPHAPVPAGCGPSPARRQLPSPVREPFLWIEGLQAPLAAGSPPPARSRFQRPSAVWIDHRGNLPAILERRPKKRQVNNPTTESSLQFLRRVGSQRPLRVKQFGISDCVAVNGMPVA